MTESHSKQSRTFARRSLAIMIAATLTLSSTSAFAGGLYNSGFDNTNSTYKLSETTKHVTKADAELVNLLQNKYAHFTKLTMQLVKENVLYDDIESASANASYFLEQMQMADGYEQAGSLKEAVHAMNHAIKQANRNKIKYKGTYKGKSNQYVVTDANKQWAQRDWAKVKANFNSQVTTIKAGLNRLENAETKADLLLLVDYTYANILEKFDRLEKMGAQKVAKRKAQEAAKAAKANVLANVKAAEVASSAAKAAKKAEKAKQAAININQVKALPVAEAKTKKIDVYKPDNTREFQKQKQNNPTGKRQRNEHPQKTGNKHDQTGGKQRGKGFHSGQDGRGHQR